MNHLNGRIVCKLSTCRMIPQLHKFCFAEQADKKNQRWKPPTLEVCTSNQIKSNLNSAGILQGSQNIEIIENTIKGNDLNPWKKYQLS